MTNSAQRRRTQLGVEMLEGRTLMAGDLISSVASPLVAALPKITLAPAINTAEVKHVAISIVGITRTAIQSAGDRFLSEALGGAVSAKVGSQLDQLAGLTSAKNPLEDLLGSKLSDLAVGKTAQLSEGEEKKKSDFDWGEFFETIVEEVTTAPAKAFSLLAAPLFGAKEAADVTGDPKDFINGVKAVTDPVNNRNGSEYLQPDNSFAPGGNAGTPNPDAPSSGPILITEEVLKALAARLGAALTPTGEEGSSGGAMNYHAIPLGKQGQWSPDMIGTGLTAVTQLDIHGIQVRIEMRINIVK